MFVRCLSFCLYRSLSLKIINAWQCMSIFSSPLLDYCFVLSVPMSVSSCCQYFRDLSVPVCLLICSSPRPRIPHIVTANSTWLFSDSILKAFITWIPPKWRCIRKAYKILVAHIDSPNTWMSYPPEKFCLVRSCFVVRALVVRWGDVPWLPFVYCRGYMEGTHT